MHNFLKALPLGVVLPAIIGAASVGPDDAASNISKWAHRLGLENLPPWLVTRSADRSVVLVTVLCAAFYTFAVWVYPRLRAARVKRRISPSLPSDLPGAEVDEPERVAGGGGSGTIVGDNGTIIGGRGGRVYGNGVGRAGDGGNGFATGNNALIIGGDGGDVGRADGVGAMSPLERLDELGLSNDTTRFLLVYAKLRQEFSTTHSGLAPPTLPEAWVNRKLQESGSPWRVNNTSSGFSLVAAQDT